VNELGAAAVREKLHGRVTRILARRVIESERSSDRAVFPNEAALCRELGVSRTVVRESMKVLADKGMVEIRPRTGTRARLRSEWRLLDPDILSWQAEVAPDPVFLRDLCEVRLAIEPTAAGFAALRATAGELEAIGQCLRKRESQAEKAVSAELIDLDLEFHAAVVAASHNPLLIQWNGTIRSPFRTALDYTSRFWSTVRLELDAHYELLEALRRHDPMAARHAAEQMVGIVMLAVEKVVRSADKGRKGAPGRTGGGRNERR
jgi:DNA-binding FadR family transcriptional regulator